MTADPVADLIMGPAPHRDDGWVDQPAKIRMRMRYGAFLQVSCKLDGWKQALDAITVLYRRRDFCNMF